MYRTMVGKKRITALALTAIMLLSVAFSFVSQSEVKADTMSAQTHTVDLEERSPHYQSGNTEYTASDIIQVPDLPEGKEVVSGNAEVLNLAEYAKHGLVEQNGEYTLIIREVEKKSLAGYTLVVDKLVHVEPNWDDLSAEQKQTEIAPRKVQIDGVDYCEWHIKIGEDLEKPIALWYQTTCPEMIGGEYDEYAVSYFATILYLRTEFLTDIRKPKLPADGTYKADVLTIKDKKKLCIGRV